MSGCIVDGPPADRTTDRPTTRAIEAVELSLQVSAKRYCEMHEILAQTHDRVWGLPWVWERWTLRPELSWRGAGAGGVHAPL